MSNELALHQEVSNTMLSPAGLQQLKMALPEHIKPERFVRCVVTAVQNTPAIGSCDKASLYSEAIKCASDGLLPDGRDAALIPFKGKVKYMPMVAGILKKVRNSGELISISAMIVYEKDDFKYFMDSEGEHLVHKPDVFSKDRGKRIGVYALAKTRDGGLYIEVMNEEQVLAVKNAGSARDGGPWKGPFEEEMWKKSAVKRLCKRLPMSTDIEAMIHADDDMYDFDKKPEENQPQATKSSRLRDAVLSKPEAQPVAEEATEVVDEEQIPL